MTGVTGDVGDGQNTATLAQCAARYLAACEHRAFSPTTLDSYRRGLRLFLAWCNERGVEQPAALTPALLNSYRRAVFYRLDRHGEPMKPRTQMSQLTPVRSLCQWLARQGILAGNPATGMDLPRFRQTLPKVLLSPQDVAALLAQVDIAAPLGLRDRALLEVAYATGLRRAELAALTLGDLDLSGGWVRVDQGKGGKDRRVPLGERAVFWLQAYLRDQRPALLGKRRGKAVYADDSRHLFLNRRGTPMTPDTLYRCLHAYLVDTNPEKAGGGHLLRHAMATHMLEQGADIRFIQQMLGHEQLTSTQIYTRVQDQKLKDVHQKTHPAQAWHARQQARQSGANEDTPDA